MKIVLDLQAAQSASRFRGVGRYSLALASALANRIGNHELWIALNGLHEETIEPLRAQFDKLVPQDRIVVFYVPDAIAENGPGNAARARAAELIRESFLSSLNPDVTLTAALFEGYIDDVATSIGMLDTFGLTAVIAHDLIPLRMQDLYLQNEVVTNWFFRKLESLKRADLVLTISEASRLELIETLNLSAAKTVNILGAADDGFRPLCISSNDKADTLTKFSITNEFLLYVGGPDPRKNIEGLIRAYALLPVSLRQKYQLVIVYKEEKVSLQRARAVIRQLGIPKDRVVFTGFVTEDEIIKLYNLCSLFVFPSLCEGFGLPILEAMKCGAPSIGSNCSSIPEIIGREDALFEPDRPQSIADKITQVLGDSNFLHSLREHGLETSKKFSWDETARRVLIALESTVMEHRAEQVDLPNRTPRLFCEGHESAFVGEVSRGMEASYAQHRISENRRLLIGSLAKSSFGRNLSQSDLIKIAFSIASNLKDPNMPGLFVDISVLVQQDARTGIQRVVRGILSELLANPPQGFRVEPVYFDGVVYRHALSFKSQFGMERSVEGKDEAILPGAGDMFLGLDFCPSSIPLCERMLKRWRDQGVKMYFCVYDLLPITLPETFPVQFAAQFAKWLRTIVAVSDGLVAISRATGEEILRWLENHQPSRYRPLNIGMFHLGADISANCPAGGQPANHEILPSRVRSRPSFLMVGTVEPRKGHGQVLAAFEMLWADGVDCGLVIVGKKGWSVKALGRRLASHPELGKRLFWMEWASDEMLLALYKECSALLMASTGEGFGLPLIEAARHKLPIIARDLPVFREVAGNHAFYFSGPDHQALESAIKQWLTLVHAGQAPKSDDMPWLTWAQSTGQLLDVIIGGKWIGAWTPRRSEAGGVACGLGS